MSKCNQSSTWFIGSDNQVIVDQVAYSLTGDYINNATVVGQLYHGAVIVMPLADSANVSVGSPISFRFLNGANGKYIGVIPSTLTLVEGTTYTLAITITTLKGDVHLELIKRVANFDER